MNTVWQRLTNGQKRVLRRKQLRSKDASYNSDGQIGLEVTFTDASAFGTLVWIINARDGQFFSLGISPDRSINTDLATAIGFIIFNAQATDQEAFYEISSLGTFTAVPEPSAGVMAGLLTCGLMTRRKKISSN